MIVNISTMVEENINVPFVWNPEENEYDVLVCIDKMGNIMVGVGVVLINKDTSEWNELKYLCVIKPYRNKGIASKIINKFLNKYEFLYLKVVVNKEACNFYLKNYKITYEREKDKNLISLK
jgi:GNAT superfamily N-acetyltransferase